MMPDPPRQNSDEPDTWRGELFTVVIAGPGHLRWGIIVRAVDAEDARAAVEARGHKALAVRKGAEKASAATRPPLGDCIRCRYSLVNLPAGAVGEVMCPECGTVNVPTAPLEARMHELRQRRWKLCLATYVWVSALVLLIAIIALTR